MYYEHVFRALNKARVKYLVAGGMAVVLHGYVRTTADLDIIIHLEEKNIDRFFNAVTVLGFKPRVPITREQFKVKSIRQGWIKDKGMMVLSFFHPTEHLKTIDVFVKEPLKYSLLANSADKLKVNDIVIPLLSIKHLTSLKKRAGRPQDLIDVANLEKIARLKRQR